MTGAAAVVGRSYPEKIVVISEDRFGAADMAVSVLQGEAGTLAAASRPDCIGFGCQC